MPTSVRFWVAIKFRRSDVGIAPYTKILISAFRVGAPSGRPHTKYVFPKEKNNGRAVIVRNADNRTTNGRPYVSLL